MGRGRAEVRRGGGGLPGDSGCTGGGVLERSEPVQGGKRSHGARRSGEGVEGEISRECVDAKIIDLVRVEQVDCNNADV